MSDRTRIDAVLREVRDWPDEERQALARELLQRKPNGFSKPRIDELVGIAKGIGPPPSDELVEQWLEEYRLSRYRQ